MFNIIIYWNVIKAYYIHWVLVQVYISGLSCCVNELERLALTEHLSSLSGVRVTRSFGVCVCFVDRCLSFFLSFLLWPLCCLSFFDLRYGFWLPLWYLQTILLTTPLFVAIAVRIDIVLYNRVDLQQSLVPTHYAYNGYVSLDSLNWYMNFLLCYLNKQQY